MRLLKLLALVALLWAAPRAAAQQAAAEPPLITVTGQAELRVPPDEAIFDLEVTKTDRDINLARRMNDESVAAVLALARRFNVPQQDVKTTYIRVNRMYNTDLIEDEDDPQARKVKREFIGYSVAKTVVIRFTDIPRFEEFFSEVLRAGVSSVDGVEFRSSQIRQHMDRARAAAVRAAREKAAALAREINQSIGKAVSIREGSFPDSRASANYAGTVSAPGFSTEEFATFAPGLLTVRAQVTVSFLLD